jgi:hypothetical protein
MCPHGFLHSCIPYKEARNPGIKKNSRKPFDLILSCLPAFLIIRKPGIYL